MTVAQLRTIALNRSTQQSISPLDPALVVDLLAEASVPFPAPVAPAPAGTSLPAGRPPRLVQVRRGQHAALQAAHLRQFAKYEEHDVAAGLLLRADVHVLFDRGLMTVNPSTRQVCLAPGLRAYASYAPLDGQPASLAGIDLLAVREHFDAATKTWVLT